MASTPLILPLQGSVQAAVARTLATLMGELGLKPGLPVTAQVIGPLPDGTTQLQVFDRMLKLPLPPGLPPGTAVTLAVRSGPDGQQLAVTLPHTATAPPRTPAAPLPLPTANAPPTPMPQTPMRAAPPGMPAAPQLAQPALTAPTMQMPAPAPAQAPMSAPPTPLPATSATPGVTSASTRPAPAQGGAMPPTVAARPTPNAVLPTPPQQLPPADVPPPLRALLTPQPPSVPAVAPSPIPASGPAAPLPPAPMVTGMVSGRTPEGLTQVSIGTQTLALNLRVPPPLHAVVTLTPLAQASPASGGVLVQVVPVSASAPQATASGQAASPALTVPDVSASVAIRPPAAPAARPAGEAGAVLREAASQAAARQTSLAPLLVTLAQAAGRLGQVPGPVAQAAMQLLGSRVNAERPIPAAVLQQAVQKSGIFLEARLGAPNAAQAMRGDVKASLLTLQAGLGTLFGAGQAPIEATRRPAPPLRGLPPRAQAAEPAPPVAEGREAVGRQLLGQAEGALHRMRLSQMASLPEAGPTAGPRADAPAEWNLEIPLLLGRELAMLALQINRDGRNKASKAGRGWQMKFSLNFSDLGEVGANVALRDDATAIAIWAEDEETAIGLNALLPDLAEGLAARGVSVGSLVCRVGAPRDGQVASGRLVDARS